MSMRRRFLLRSRRRRWRSELIVRDGNVLLHLVDFNGEAIARPRDCPTIGNLDAAVGSAVISVVDLRGVASQRSLAITDKAQQKAGLLIEVETQGRLSFVAAHDEISIVTIDFLARRDDEFLVLRLEMGREGKVSVHARGLIVCGRHHAHTSGKTEPPGVTVKRRNAVTVRGMGYRSALVRGLGKKFNDRIFLAGSTELTLFDPDGNFLQSIGATDRRKMLVQ